jgi:hypothetical protein
LPVQIESLHGQHVQRVEQPIWLTPGHPLCACQGGGFRIDVVCFDARGPVQDGTPVDPTFSTVRPSGSIGRAKIGGPQHPTARWTAQQVIEAFRFDESPRFLIRDRDAIYGDVFRERVRNMGIDEVIITYRSPWQSSYVERVIGSIRRECLNLVIVLNERHLRRILTSYFAYYHESRAHLWSERNAPVPRRVEHPSEGKVIAIPHVGGLRHRYTPLPETDSFFASWSSLS